MTTMNSNRPYLLRAFFDWIVDNDCTPYIVVNAHYPSVEVPQAYVNDGQIVLNIAPRAVSDFYLDLQIVSFTTRFGGVPTDIQLPTQSVMGIYAQENGQGIVFENDQTEPTPPQRPRAVKKNGDKAPGGSKPRASLRVIK